MIYHDRLESKVTITRGDTRNPLRVFILWSVRRMDAWCGVASKQEGRVVQGRVEKKKGYLSCAFQIVINLAQCECEYPIYLCTSLV